jgi:hypothetical protein
MPALALSKQPGCCRAISGFYCPQRRGHMTVAPLQVLRESPCWHAHLLHAAVYVQSSLGTALVQHSTCAVVKRVNTELVCNVYIVS